MKNKNLTNEEKIKLLIGKDFWSNDSCNGKVYSFIVSDGPAGLRHCSDMVNNTKVIPSIWYPCGQALANTWNLDIARKIGNALANDCIEQNVDILLAPGVNIKRVPTCGRNFEYFSEDPLLAGEMGKAYISGVEEKHVGTSLKHYCCNNIEYSRHWISSDVDERTLHELYLVPFEIACEAKPSTVMCAYNLVNGERMSEHKELYGILRNKFGFDGPIISDWRAVKDRIASLNAGLDLQMPWDKKYYDDLVDAYNNGTLPMDKVEESAERVVKLADKCENNKKIQKIDMTVSEREAISLEGAEEGIVLLKNNNVLPLSGREKTMITGGPVYNRYYGGGSSAVTLRTPYVSLDKTLKQYISDVTYKESICYSRGHLACIGNLRDTVAYSKTCDVSVICVGNDELCEMEGFDRLHIKLTREEEDTILKVSAVSKKTIVIVYAGSAIDMSAWADKVDCIIWAGYAGEYVNEALAKVLVGKVNPSGKLTETIANSLDDIPAIHSYRDENCLRYEEGLNVGYRYFNTNNKEVMFPFGFGLSYSNFVYSNIQVDGAGCDFKVTFDIENCSDLDGKEVAQLYVKQIDKKIYRPDKELKAFKKVFVPAHKKVCVELKLNRRSFAYYSTDIHNWKVESGLFEIEICKNVEQIELTKVIEVKE